MPKNSAPPRMLCSPLRLKKMTLSGIGPYLHGSTLDIKPLTVLCGENGSGKSTWLSVLDAFKNATENELFPIAGHSESEAADLVGWLPGSDRFRVNEVLQNGGLGNRRMSLEERKRAIEFLCKTDTDEDQRITETLFGAPGSVGFQIAVIRNLSIEHITFKEKVFGDVPKTIPCRILWLGEVPVGGDLKLRWSFPWYLPVTPMPLRIELSLSSGAVLRLESEVNSEVDELWTFQCSRVFFTDSDADGLTPVSLGTVRSRNPASIAKSIFDSVMLEQLLPNCPVPKSIADQMLSNFLILFREISREMMRGYFHIGALRQYLNEVETRAAPQRSREFDLEIDESSGVWQEQVDGFDDDQLNGSEIMQDQLKLNERYVGLNGSMTQEQHAHWAYNLMRQPNSPRCGVIENSFVSQDFPEGIAASIESLPLEILTRILETAPPELCEGWRKSDRGSIQRDEVGLGLLNESVKCRSLFSRNCRPDFTGLNSELIEMFGETSDEQDERLSSSKILGPDEIIRLNRLLLEAAFNGSGKTKCLHRTGYLFETFVSFWLKHLTKTALKYGDFEGSSLDSTWATGKNDASVIAPPTGGLTEMRRNGRARGTNAESHWGYTVTDGRCKDDLKFTIMPPTAAGSANWHMMSTGFHQLAPIVVQAGLIHQNELMAVENPEAHLHPSLQIKVAEFLCHQATSGKIMLIETHSDLIVRRILRAIREEEISPGNVFKQSNVGVYFTSLATAHQGFKHATMVELKINDQGQIDNWPQGFMDDDLKEADRWLTSIERKRSQEYGS